MSFTIRGPKHTFWQGPWRNCSRCDWKTKIADMRWQRGLLLCPSCFDSWPLLGQREIGIDRVLSDGKEEMAPVEKLRNPTEMEQPEDFVL